MRMVAWSLYTKYRLEDEALTRFRSAAEASDKWASREVDFISGRTH
jgi:hypothetical protein